MRFPLLVRGQQTKKTAREGIDYITTQQIILLRQKDGRVADLYKNGMALCTFLFKISRTCREASRVRLLGRVFNLKHASRLRVRRETRLPIPSGNALSIFKSSRNTWREESSQSSAGTLARRSHFFKISWRSPDRRPMLPGRACTYNYQNFKMVRYYRTSVVCVCPLARVLLTPTASQIYSKCLRKLSKVL